MMKNKQIHCLQFNHVIYAFANEEIWSVCWQYVSCTALDDFLNGLKTSFLQSRNGKKEKSAQVDADEPLVSRWLCSLIGLSIGLKRLGFQWNVQDDFFSSLGEK